MPDGIRWVGLDVHAHESTIAIFDQGTGELMTRRVVGRPHELMPWLRGVTRPARMVYEAGPTGYGLARRARSEGIELAVCAPGHAERPPHDRVKTDKRDAIRLARRLAAGELTLITVPSVEHEQLRDLVRCREDVRGDLMRARHRLGKFLLRREIYYEGPHTTWSRRHRAWLASLKFADRASQLTMVDYLHAHDVLLARRDRIEAELEQLASDSPWKVTIGRLRCLRGIDTLSALGLCAEIGQFDRFGHPDQLAAYLGIVPSENTTGERRRQGAITKAGSTHARRLLGRGRLPLPAPPRHRPDARAPPTRPARPDHRHRLARATAAARPLAPAQARPRQAQRHRRRRDCPRARRLLLGDRHHQLTSIRLSLIPFLAAGTARRLRTRAQPVREWLVSNPPASGPRSISDGGPCDEQRSWGTQPPHMRLTERREHGRGRVAPTARNHNRPPHPHQPRWPINAAP